MKASEVKFKYIYFKVLIDDKLNSLDIKWLCAAIGTFDLI